MERSSSHSSQAQSSEEILAATHSQVESMTYDSIIVDMGSSPPQMITSSTTVWSSTIYKHGFANGLVSLMLIQKQAHPMLAASSRLYSTPDYPQSPSSAHLDRPSTQPQTNMTYKSQGMKRSSSGSEGRSAKRRTLSTEHVHQSGGISLNGKNTSTGGPAQEWVNRPSKRHPLPFSLTLTRPWALESSFAHEDAASEYSPSSTSTGSETRIPTTDTQARTVTTPQSSLPSIKFSMPKSAQKKSPKQSILALKVPVTGRKSVASDQIRNKPSRRSFQRPREDPYGRKWSRNG